MAGLVSVGLPTSNQFSTLAQAAETCTQDDEVGTQCGGGSDYPYEIANESDDDTDYNSFQGFTVAGSTGTSVLKYEPKWYSDSSFPDGGYWRMLYKVSTTAFTAKDNDDYDRVDGLLGSTTEISWPSDKVVDADVDKYSIGKMDYYMQDNDEYEWAQSAIEAGFAHGVSYFGGPPAWAITAAGITAKMIFAYADANDGTDEVTRSWDWVADGNPKPETDHWYTFYAKLAPEESVTVNIEDSTTGTSDGSTVGLKMKDGIELSITAPSEAGSDIESMSTSERRSRGITTTPASEVKRNPLAHGFKPQDSKALDPAENVYGAPAKTSARTYSPEFTEEDLERIMENVSDW